MEVTFGTGELIGGRYRLEELIGSGGMGEVFRARDTLLERPVALKLVDVGDPRRRRDITNSFLREARISAAIAHRNVVQILDFGTHDERIPYIVMELLEGESLADRLARGERLGFAFALKLMDEVLDGLAAAHDAGVVHRDLKPENIFLASTRDGLCPKILDFGISKLMDGKGGTHVTTTHGHVVGTPAYMSPEQARGVRSLDRRTDVYSMGVVLYELLSGTLPFSSEHAGDLMVKIVIDDPQPLTARVPGIPRTLSDVVGRALHKSPSARFADARALRAALRAASDELLSREDLAELEQRALPPPWRKRALISVAGLSQSDETGFELPPPRSHLLLRWGRRHLTTAVSLAIVGGALGVTIALLGRSSAESGPRFIVVQADERAPAERFPDLDLTEPLPERDEPPPSAPETRAARAGSSPASRLASVFRKQKQGVVSCVNQHVDAARRTPKLAVRIALEPSGRVSDARVLPEHVADSELGACIASAVRRMSFPRQPSALAFEVPLTAR